MRETRHLHPVERGRIVLAHGQRLPTHAHDHGHLVYPATGVLSVTTSGGTWIAPPTRVAWTPAAFAHHHTAHGDADMRILFLFDALAARLPAHPAVLTVSALAREALLALTAEEAGPGGRAAEAEPGGRTPEAVDRLQAVVVDELTAAPEQPLHLPEPADDRLRALTGILYADPANQQTLAELGTRVGASERTLSRLFGQELRMSFHQWRTQLRVHHALARLAAGKSVTDTALACGWANATSFIEAFTALVGETPGRYRNRQLHTETG
ncbi:AraC family transcriptional regulator [Streptomyces sp. NPDC004959]|uniref:AraC family transcriptional regulator n=1 Tax=unclassified Streptomyces TaxID=2593676 RepID=UPI0033AC22FC